MTFVVEDTPSKVNGVCVPWTDLPFVVLIFAVSPVPGWITWPICICKTSYGLFCVAVTLVPPTSPVALAAPPATTS